jgi:type I restriction enzyme S subunit
MNAARLLERFDRISDASDAVLRLRRFVLDLAVRGKLVAQRPSDTLFLVPSKNRHQVCEPFSLPGKWRWIAFGEIHDLVRGVTYTKADVGDAADEKHVAILRANNIGAGINLDELVYVHRRCVSEPQMLRRGDFLIALSSGSKNLVGKAAAVDEPIDAAFGGFCGAIRLTDENLRPFVKLFLTSPLYREAIAAGSRGIGINNLKRSTLDSIPFPLPPLAEQQRIVAKVDELMALCDRLEAAQAEREARRDRLVAASLARVSQPAAADAGSDARAAGFHLDHFARLTTRPEHVKHLRQTILNLAVRGRLVPQDPADASPPERFSASTDSPAEQTTTGRKTRYLETEDDRYPIPASWLWSRLGLVGDWGSGTTPSRGKSEYFGGDISWFKSGELNDNPCLRGSEEKVSRLALEDCSFRDNQPGDVLFAMYGATIGKVAILAEPAVTNQAVVACTSCEYLFNRYLFLFLLSQRQRFHEASEGGAQPNVSKAKVVRCPIPLPPLAEQRRIVAKVDELMALCDQLEASLAAAATDRARLLESLLHEAVAPAA